MGFGGLVYIGGCCSCGFLLVDGYDWMLVDNRRLQFLTALGGYYSLEMNLICSVESSVLRTQLLSDLEWLWISLSKSQKDRSCSCYFILLAVLRDKEII